MPQRVAFTASGQSFTQTGPFPVGAGQPVVDVDPVVGHPNAAESLARIFKALADPARVKIVSLLLNTDEICACDVATAIGKTAATASHHLKLLRDAGLVIGDKRGTWIFYRAVPERVTAIGDALSLTR